MKFMSFLRRCNDFPPDSARFEVLCVHAELSRTLLDYSERFPNRKALVRKAHLVEAGL